MRFLLPLLLAVAIADSCAQAPANPVTSATTKPASEPPLTWHDVTAGAIEGRAWPEEERLRWFDRFPASAQGKVTTNVWNLSRDSAGMMVRFKTDAVTIWAHYVLAKEKLAGANMTAIGASGLDLYARGADGKWKWVGVTKPDKQEVAPVDRRRPHSGFA